MFVCLYFTRSKCERVGLGNGKKKSGLFNDYVLKQREFLRTECALCEKASQRLLGYSNNLLYRKLKTEEVTPASLIQTSSTKSFDNMPCINTRKTQCFTQCWFSLPRIGSVLSCESVRVQRVYRIQTTCTSAPVVTRTARAWRVFVLW